jgi:hypothetical protein
LVAYNDGTTVMGVPFAGGRAPAPLVQSNLPLREPAFSPDSSRLALTRIGGGGFLCDAVFIVPVTPAAPVVLVGGDDDPYRLIIPPQTRISSCGQAMFWR